MGKYFNPPQHEAIIRAGGTQIEGSDYDQLNTNVNKGENLYGLYERSRFNNCPHLYNKDEFDSFNNQVLQGSIKLIRYYSIPKNIEARETPVKESSVKQLSAQPIIEQVPSKPKIGLKQKITDKLKNLLGKI